MKDMTELKQKLHEPHVLHGYFLFFGMSEGHCHYYRFKTRTE